MITKCMAASAMLLFVLTALSSAQPVDSIAAPDTAAKTPDSVAMPEPQLPEVGGAAPTAVKKHLRLFSPAQFDSVLSLAPACDSIRESGEIVGISVDEQTGDIVIISLDGEGNPGKYVCPGPEVKRQQPVTTLAVPQEAQSRQKGRMLFMIESAVKSAFVYPGAYSAVIPDAEGSIIAGVSLLTIGGTLYGTYAFTRNMELGYGKVGLMNYGSTLCGLYYPSLLAGFLVSAFSIDEGHAAGHMEIGKDGYPEYHEFPVPSDYIRSIGSMLGFPLGMYLGSRWNIAGNHDYGKVAVMQYFSQTFGGLGFVLPLYLFDFEDDGKAYAATSTFLSMCFLPGGLYAGYKIAGNKSISAGRGVLPWWTGCMGVATGIGLTSLFEPDLGSGMATARLYATTGLLGYGFGTWLGFSYHESIDYTFWQSIFMGVSTVAGATMGVAFPLIAQADDHQPYTLCALIGGWTGFILGERLSLSLFERSGRDKQASNLQINMPGLAVLPLLAASGKSGIRYSRPGGSGFSPYRALLTVPVANVEWRF